MELCLHKILSRRSFGVEFHNIASFGWRLSLSCVKGHGTKIVWMEFRFSRMNRSVK